MTIFVGRKSLWAASQEWNS